MGKQVAVRCTSFGDVQWGAGIEADKVYRTLIMHGFSKDQALRAQQSIDESPCGKRLKVGSRSYRAELISYDPGLHILDSSFCLLMKKPVSLMDAYIILKGAKDGGYAIGCTYKVSDTWKLTIKYNPVRIEIYTAYYEYSNGNSGKIELDVSMLDASGRLGLDIVHTDNKNIKVPKSVENAVLNIFKKLHLYSGFK